MRPGPAQCRAFLLRVWVRERDGTVVSSIRDVESGETRVFATLDQLTDWLAKEMRGPSER